MLAAQLINIYMRILHPVTAQHGVQAPQSISRLHTVNESKVWKRSLEHANSVSKNKSCGARAPLWPKKKVEPRLRFLDCPRGGGALEHVCFCLFIGSNGWSLMASDYTTSSWQSNAFALRQGVENTISARLLRCWTDYDERRKIYQPDTICGFLCLHCSMGAPLVLIDLGSRFYCWVCIARRREETIGLLNYTAQNADHFALFVNSRSATTTFQNLFLSNAFASIKIWPLKYCGTVVYLRNLRIMFNFYSSWHCW